MTPTLVDSLITLLNTQIALIGPAIISVLTAVLPIAVGLMLFYFGWRKVRSAIH